MANHPAQDRAYAVEPGKAQDEAYPYDPSADPRKDGSISVRIRLIFFTSPTKKHLDNEKLTVKLKTNVRNLKHSLSCPTGPKSSLIIKSICLD